MLTPLHLCRIPPVQLFPKHIHFRLRKLARRDLALKQQIELGKRSAGRFGHAKVGKDDAEETGAGPKEAGKIVPVPRGGVDHGWGEDVDDDGGDVVGGAAELMISVCDMNVRK